MARKKKSNIEEVEKVKEGKKYEGKKYPVECIIVEKFYFSNPKDCKKDFDKEKAIGYEKMVNGRHEVKQGNKSAYIIIRKSE